VVSSQVEHTIPVIAPQHPPMTTDQDKFAQKAVGGAFVRLAAKFQSTISDAPGAEFPPESGRYRLFAAHA